MGPKELCDRIDEDNANGTVDLIDGKRETRMRVVVRRGAEVVDLVRGTGSTVMRDRRSNHQNCPRHTGRAGEWSLRL